MMPSSVPPAAKVVIVEDDDSTREYLCTAIAALPGFALAASFDRIGPAISWLETAEPDVLLTDLGLPDGSGIEVIRSCAKRWPNCDIMVISMFGDEKNVLASIEVGATGYILKDSEQLDMSRAVQDLRNGGSPMSPQIARKVLERALQQTAQPTTPMAPTPPASNITLTKREAETLNLIARGYTYDEVARLLSVSLSTVKTHIRGIYGKLAVNSRGEAVFEAHKLGLLQNGLFTQ